MYNNLLTTLTAFLATAQAVAPPIYSGYTQKWSQNFTGPYDTLPSRDFWNPIESATNDNNEVQVYRYNKANLRFTGTDRLQIIPRKDAVGGWTSGRIESKASFTPVNGKVTRFEASLRVSGTAAKNKKGIWYAFWLMGESFRKKTKAWPACGELDIFENINGEAQNYGVAHCDVYPGGACKEPEGLVKTTPLLDNQLHTWKVEVDRRPTDWMGQKLTWFVDGKVYHQVLGKDVNNLAAWQALAHSPLYIILNVAVGGNWVRTCFDSDGS